MKAFFRDEAGKEGIVITLDEGTMADGNVVTDETAAYCALKEVDGRLLICQMKVIMVSSHARR